VVQTWIIGLNWQRTGSWKQKVCVVKQFSQKCGLIGHCLSPCSGRGSGVVIWIYCWLAGGPSWGRSTVGGSFCPLSWRCYHLSFLESNVIAKRMA
jgi:hypothetical protein